MRAIRVRRPLAPPRAPEVLERLAKRIALHVYPDGATVASSRLEDGRTLRVVGVLGCQPYESPREELLKTLALEEDRA